MKSTKPNNHIRSLPPRWKVSRLALPLALLSGAGLLSPVMGEDVSLTENDPANSSSFNVAGRWSNGVAPSAGNHYFTQGFTLRTPVQAGDFPFGGDSLTVGSGGRLIGKTPNGTTQTITIKHLILDGGDLLQGTGTNTTGVVLNVHGDAITVTAPSSIRADGGGGGFEILDIHVPISGGSDTSLALANEGSKRGVVRLRAANDFAGEVIIGPNTPFSPTHRLLQLSHVDALRHATLDLNSTGQNLVSFAAEANTEGSVFRVASLYGISVQTLADTAGDPVTLEVGGTNQDSDFFGELRGSGDFIKAGTGTMYLNGKNALSGKITVQGGVLSIWDDGPEGAELGYGSTVEIAVGAQLELQNLDPFIVRELILDNVSQIPGTYDSGHEGGLITGDGAIIVDPDYDPPVLLTANDPGNTSSINSPGQWSNAEVPSPGHDYFTQTFTLRTPQMAGGNFTFQGDSLTIGAGGPGSQDQRLLGKALNGPAQILTVPNLILNGGRIEQADGRNTNPILVLEGNIQVQADSTIGALGAAPGATPNTNFNTLEIKSVISGEAGLTVAGTANGGTNTGLVILSAANSYSGVITIAQPNITEAVPSGHIASVTGRLLQLNHPDALQNATLSLSTLIENGISFAAAANTGPFRIGALTGAAHQTLADTNGDPVTADVGGNNGSTTYSGTLDGPGSLTKSGTGTLTLPGEHGYTGTTTVSGGTLVLERENALHDASTVSVAGSGILNLAHEGVDVVRRLILNNVEQDAGTYHAGNSSGRITGSGSILVVPGSGFNAFMDGFPELTEAEKADDADPDGDGIANLLEYALDGLDPTAPDSLPALDGGGTIAFVKRALAVSNDDVVYIIETSTTLGAGSSPWTAVTPDVDDATTISYTLPPGSPRNFVRLRVEPAGDQE